MTNRPRAQLHPPFLHSGNPTTNAQTDEQKHAPQARPEWHAFDWKSVASLRSPDKPGIKAERAWEATEWDDPANPLPQEARKIAQQLDAVAQKIRSGELSVDGSAPTPETAMAAALEALIRAK